MAGPRVRDDRSDAPRDLEARLEERRRSADIRQVDPRGARFFHCEQVFSHSLPYLVYRTNTTWNNIKMQMNFQMAGSSAHDHQHHGVPLLSDSTALPNDSRHVHHRLHNLRFFARQYVCYYNDVYPRLVLDRPRKIGRSDVRHHPVVPDCGQCVSVSTHRARRLQRPTAHYEV